MNSVRKKFKGGYRFKRFKADTPCRRDVVGIPQTVLLSMPFESGVMGVLVKPGEKVSAGQPIGKIGADTIVATVSGTIESVVDADEEKKINALVAIRSNGSPDWLPLDSLAQSWKTLLPSDLATQISQAGFRVLFPQAQHPLFTGGAVKYIVSGVDAEPYLSPLGTILVGEDLESFVSGLEMVGRLSPKSTVYIAVSSKDTDALQALGAKNVSTNCTMVVLEPKYPASVPDLVASCIEPQKVASSKTLNERGFYLLSVSDIIALGEAVTKKKPCIDRLICCSGPMLKENAVLRVRLGMRVTDIVSPRLNDQTPIRVVADSLMTGAAVVPQSPIPPSACRLIVLEEAAKQTFMDFILPGFNRDSYSRTFGSMLGLCKNYSTTNVHGEPRPCISCSFCQEVCPAGILPNILYHYGNKDIINETLLQLRIFNCIDCNLCNYVCPSKLHVAQSIAKGKRGLKEQGYV